MGEEASIGNTVPQFGVSSPVAHEGASQSKAICTKSGRISRPPDRLMLKLKS